MPKGAEILKLDIQKEQLCLWALVNPEKEKVTRTFITYGTGHKVVNSDILEYIDTYQLYGGDLIFHLFEKKI